MNAWRQVSWKRVGVIVPILVGVAALLDWARHDLLALYFARETAKGEPNLSSVPEPVPDKTVAVLDGLHLNHFEYSLRVPWREADFERDAKSVVGIHFRSGAGLMMFDPLSAVDAVKEMRGRARSDTRKLRRIFGDRALSSNYDFMAAEMAVTPSEIKWWNPPGANARCLVLLNLKAMEIHGISNAIYRRSSEEMRGFQFGNPSVAPYQVELNLFDRNDRRYKIIITGKKPAGQAITQAEINAMVASLRSIPHS